MSLNIKKLAKSCTSLKHKYTKLYSICRKHFKYCVNTVFAFKDIVEQSWSTKLTYNAVKNKLNIINKNTYIDYFLLIYTRNNKSILFYDQFKSTYLSRSAWCLVRIPQWFSLYTWLYKNLLTLTNEGSETETSCWDQLSLSTSHSLHQSVYIPKHCWTWGLILNYFSNKLSSNT